MTRPLKLFMALALLCASAISAMALPNASAIQPANGYATISANGGNPLNVTVTATKPGFGVFWVAIASDVALDAKSNSVGWATSPDKDGAVWRTNTGAKGGMLIPAGQAGYSGFPQSGSFIAEVQKPKKGPAPTPTTVHYVIHVINLATGNTFWTTPGGGTPPPPNNPPTAQDDCTIDVVADTPVVINVLDNDLPAGSVFTITGFTQPQHGSVMRNGDDTFTYIPNAGYTGPDSFTYTISNGAVCSNTNPGSSDPYTLTSTVLPGGDVKVVLRQSRSVVDNTYGVNSSPGYPRQGQHWFKDLLNSDHARFVLKNAAGQTVMDFYVDYLSASKSYPSGYGTLGVTGGDGSISVGSAANIVSVTTTMTTNLNQAPSFYGYTVDSPAPEANFPTWDYVNGYTVVISKNAFGPSGFGSVDSPDVHNSPAKKDGAVTPPTTVPCTSTAKVCLNVKGTPPPPPSCAGYLIFGPDRALTTDVADYLVTRGISPNDIVVKDTTWGTYTPGELTKTVADFVADKGAKPCAILFDPEYVGPNGKYGGMDAQDQQTLKDLILSGTGLVYPEPLTDAAMAPQYNINSKGQLADILPVSATWTYDLGQTFEVLDLTNPITANLPGLTLNNVTGRYGFDPDSQGQDTAIALDGAVPGVTFSSVTPLLVTNPGNTTNSFSLLYQPTTITAAQPGGRVVVLGTDTYPNTGGVVSQTNLALFYNALVWAAGN